MTYTKKCKSCERKYEPPRVDLGTCLVCERSVEKERVAAKKKAARIKKWEKR